MESDTLPGVENPLGVDSLDRWTGGLELASNIVLSVLALAALASFVVRVVRAGATERRQLAWVGLGIVSALVAVSLAPWWGVGAAVLLVPAGLALAAYRYRLYDVDLIVSRALVAGVLLGGAALVYVAVVGWVGALVDSSGSAVSFAAAFAVALAFHPARVRVQRGVDRLLYGQRGDPSALLARLDDAVRSAGSSRDALQDGVALVAARTQAAVRRRGGAPEVGEVVRTASGEHPGSPPHVLDLVLHGEHVGRLLAAARPGTGGLGRADLRALSVVAGPFANAAFALRMAGDLEESRERLVTAREEERRRLRRDMHDGLGPQMSGVVMCLDTAAAALRRDDPDRAAELVAAATGQAQEAVADVRRLVHGLRPPALDDLGLAGALRALESTVAEGGMRMTVTCHGSPDGAAGRGRGGRLPDRPGGAHQRRPARRRHHRRGVAGGRRPGRGVGGRRRGGDPGRSGGRRRSRLHARARGGGGRLPGGQPRATSRDAGHRDLPHPECGPCAPRAAGGVAMTGWLRAVVADDHPVFRQGLRVLLEDIGVDVVGEAADGEQAVALAHELAPDVVLMDLQMPVLGGVEATRRLAAEKPDVHVLVLTMVDDDSAVFAAIQAGALGYLLKGAGQEEIGRALRGVAAGEAVYGPEAAARVRAFFTAGSGVAAKPFPALSDREREVLDLMAAGHPTRSSQPGSTCPTRRSATT